MATKSHNADHTIIWLFVLKASAGVSFNVKINSIIYGMISSNKGVIFMAINSDASLKLVLRKTKIDDALSGHFNTIQWKRLMNPSMKSRLAAVM